MDREQQRRIVYIDSGRGQFVAFQRVRCDEKEAYNRKKIEEQYNHAYSYQENKFMTVALTLEDMDALERWVRYKNRVMRENNNIRR
jgi:3-methyladenine DNA glycosylase AlkC